MLSQNPLEKITLTSQMNTQELSTDDIVIHESLPAEQKVKIIQGRLALARTSEEKIPLIKAYYDILGPTDYS